MQETFAYSSKCIATCQ